MFHSVTLVLFFSLLLWVGRTSYWIQGVLAMNVLVGGPFADPNTMNVTANQYLNVANLYLVMQSDCSLVTFNGSTPILTTYLAGRATQKTHCSCTLQNDGNFVVYGVQNLTAPRTTQDAMWASGTYALGFNSSRYIFLILQPSGSLSMYEPDGTAVEMRPFQPVSASAMSQLNATNPFQPELAWKPTLPLDGYPYMPAGYFLSQGSKLQTLHGKYILLLGHDCKLQSQEVWKENKTAKSVIWNPQQSMDSGVVSDINCQLTLQQDGRLEVRDNASGVVYWNGSVSGNDTVNWALKVNADDGHVSVSDILDPSIILWTNLEDHNQLIRPRSGSVNTVDIWPVVLGVMGGVLLAVASLGVWYFYFRPKYIDPSEKAFQQRLQSIGGKVQVLSEAKIKQATNNLGKNIGCGGFGDVFYGILADGQEIAAKVMTAGSHQSKEEFYNEIELLSVVHHKYLVSLLGYSSTKKHQVLIYEYMGGGDLRHRLQGAGATKNPLSWRQRTSIVLQIAEGLEYLHDKCSPAIIHRDVKSDNILLTTDLLVAKVADFGLSKLRRKDRQDATHVTTAVKGTPGYVDPEYHETGTVTEKSDVYAFGIVLMEILTGQHQMSIAQGVSEARRLGQFDGLADPNLGGGFDRDEFVSLVELSLWCARKSNLRRPHMREVMQKLRVSIGITPLESMQPEDVMTFGIDFDHSEADSQDVLSFSKFPSSCNVTDIVSGQAGFSSKSQSN